MNYIFCVVKTQWIDLTHTLSPEIPTWSGQCLFKMEIKEDYPKGCRVLNYQMVAGIGTHMDAPSHFIPQALNIADIALEQLCVPAFVINVTDQVNKNPGYDILPQDILAFEKRNGLIEENSLVVGYTGWSKYWRHQTKYRNTDKKGKMIFPGFHEEAAALLLERNIAGIGIDTLSPDDGEAADSFPVHHKILGASKYILENLTRLDQLPEKGAYILSLPIKVQGGTEAPARVIAMIF